MDFKTSLVWERSEGLRSHIYPLIILSNKSLKLFQKKGGKELWSLGSEEPGQRKIAAMPLMQRLFCWHTLERLRAVSFG